MNDDLPQPPNGLPFFVAHTPPKGQDAPWHSLQEHLECVTKLAVEYASVFGGQELARYVSLLHDLGKFDPTFQRYLYRCYLHDRGQGPKPRAGEAPHKQAGTLVAWNALPKIAGMDFNPSNLVAQIIYGHHSQILNCNDTSLKASESQKSAEWTTDEMLRAARSCSSDFAPALPKLSVLIPKPFQPFNTNRAAVEMFARFVYSCLTDADGLDTEKHKNRSQSQLRESEQSRLPTMAEMRDILFENQKKLPADDGAVNRVRRTVYADCLHAACNKPGVYSLTVPTGGGKTRSALAFALSHAVENKLRRVVYAAPFTSILDQTAGEFEKIFGVDSRVVLEHHSAVESKEELRSQEDEDKELWRRLASENWDAPLIVTTQVQLFESLFSNRPGKCRKLHRLANSVLILDEVQTLPAKLLRPLVEGLQLLAKNFGVTIVLCTATQPSLETQALFYKGFNPPPVEIVQNPKAHFAALRRVHYEMDFAPKSWAEIARQMRESGSCLCVVNTRRQAVDLLNVLDRERADGSVFHLSTLMCGRHRRKTLDEVKARLDLKLPTLLVSTTVVEAGVDVDFPRLMRAFAPLPSLIQAAGRCNREGKDSWQDCEVTIFVPEDDQIPSDGFYRACRSLTRRRIEAAAAANRTFDFDDPDVVKEWFTTLIHDLGNLVDANDVRGDVENFRFDAVAEKVRLIPDDTVPVLPLAYAREEAQAILDEAERIGHMTRDLWRKLQPLCVSVYANSAQGLEHPNLPGLYVWPGEYDSKAGMPFLSDPGKGVVYPPEELMA